MIKFALTLPVNVIAVTKKFSIKYQKSKKYKNLVTVASLPVT
jgi:hypothetical protein